MSNVRSWFRSASSNASPSPDGFPELMARSGLNDSARETQAAVKRHYDSPDFRRPFEDYVLVRVTGTHFTLTDGAVEVDASLLLEVGQRIRMPGAGGEAGKVWEGFITDTPIAPAYSAPATTFHVEWILADSEDIDGPVLLPAFVEVSFKELGRAAWYDTGAVDGKIPLFEDLDAHVLKAEDELDVGFVDGVTREQIKMAGARGRLNANGGMSVWQRGDSFTAATPMANDPDNLCADNWVILSDGAGRVDITRLTGDYPSGIGVGDSMLLTAATVPGNQKHGVMTIIELDDGLDIGPLPASEKVSISLWAKLGSVTGIDKVRAYVLSIKNRAPTTTPVSAWSSGSAGTNVGFNVADWVLDLGSAVPPFLEITLASAWTRYVIEGIDLDIGNAGFRGIAIAVITDDATIISGAQWVLAAVQANRGVKALPFIVTPAALERQRCLRYFESTFDEDLVRPDHNAGNAHALAAISAGVNAVADWQFAAPKFKTPTLATYNPSVAAPATGDWYDGTVERAVSSSDLNTKGVRIFCTTATASTVHRIAASVHANVWGNN